MIIALHGRELRDKAFPYAADLFEQLQKHGAQVLIHEPFLKMLRAQGINCGACRVYNTPAETAEADFFFSIGGDGTLLETVTYSGARQVPVLGINAGRLGFLATTSGERLHEVLPLLFEGKFRLEERTLIRLDSELDFFEGLNFGLNEFTITKRDNSSMILVHTYLNNQFLNSYWADGLIVATPTGATGYSLSCGGPLVMPDCGNFIICPVNPHNLSVRPIVVSDANVISFRIEGRSKKFLISLDSRSKPVKAGLELSVRKEDFKAKLVKFEGDTYMGTLRTKLNWGFDVRN